MVLHIAVDGLRVEALTALLYEHYKSKKYNVRLCRRPDHKPIHEILRHYNLLNHEKALLYALDESLTYYMEDWSEYDLVFWQGSILEDYLSLNGVSSYWLSQINKFVPKKDLYCYIKEDKSKVLDEPFNILKETLILNDTGNIETNLKELINQINEMFPKCQWCNHIYKKNKNHIKYCSKTCSHLANQKQVRDRVNRYNKLHRNSNASNYNSNLGSNALLKQHSNNDFHKEHKSIKNEKRRLGI